MFRRRQITQFSFLSFLFLIPVGAQNTDGLTGVSTQTTQNDTVPNYSQPIPIRSPINRVDYLSQGQLYPNQNNPGKYSTASRGYVNYQPSSDEEDYQQAIQSAGIRSSNDEINVQSSSYPSSFDSNPYSNTYYVATAQASAPSGNYYGNNQRLITGEKTASPFANDFPKQNFKSEANFGSQMMESPKLSNFDVPSDTSFTPQSVISSLSGSNGGFANPNENLFLITTPTIGNNPTQFVRNNFNEGSGFKQPSRFSPNSGSNEAFNLPFNGNVMVQNQGQNGGNGFSNNNGFVPAIAIAHPLNFGFGGMGGGRQPNNNNQMPMRPVMNQGSNFNPNGILGANTLSMPMFFAPNMGMNRLSMPYPGAFSPMIYPSPMFIPTVNPYSPFFPARGNKGGKQKVKSENRDDRDDNEDLFEDDVSDQDGDD